MKVHVVLGLGIVLGLVGASLLVAFSILYVKPYMLVRDMEPTTCITVTSFAGDVITCTCQDSGSSCRSRYPCLQVWVNFTTSDGEDVNNASLYNSYQTFQLQRDAKQCSIYTCSQPPQKNLDKVLSFHEQYGEPGTEFDCYYQPGDVTYVIIDVVTVTAVIHCMFWPSLALIIGLIILCIYVCDVDVMRRKRKKQDRQRVGSMERPWQSRQDFQNYEKVRTSSASRT